MQKGKVVDRKKVEHLELDVMFASIVLLDLTTREYIDDVIYG
jgi:hypothetical protein